MGIMESENLTNLSNGDSIEMGSQTAMKSWCESAKVERQSAQAEMEKAIRKSQMKAKLLKVMRYVLKAYWVIQGVLGAIGIIIAIIGVVFGSDYGRAVYVFSLFASILVVLLSSYAEYELFTK